MIPYTYRCEVVKVVDGDTVDVRIDLGFKVTTIQRVRLARVDSEELKDPEPALRIKANEQKATLTDILAKAQDLVIATSKSDIYGRYIGELSFIGPFEPAKRILLSDFLLQNGWRKY